MQGGKYEGGFQVQGTIYDQEAHRETNIDDPNIHHHDGAALFPPAESHMSMTSAEAVGREEMGLGDCCIFRSQHHHEHMTPMERLGAERFEDCCMHENPKDQGHLTRPGYTRWVYTIASILGWQVGCVGVRVGKESPGLCLMMEALLQQLRLL